MPGEMQVPSVVIVGRPNVGKSSLFNALYGQRVAIVEATAGVTRDRISRLVERDGRTFELVDTGGIGIEEELAEHIELQIRIALEQAALVLLVVDAREGLQPLDQSIATDLRSAGKPILLVVNKCDGPEQEAAAAEFYALGFPELHPTSAAHRRGIQHLAERVLAILPGARPQEPEAPPLKVAFVGRRNVGKSTLVNRLAQSPRVVVSELPGTTRDSVDVRFRVDGMEFVAIDTAGVRHRKQVKTAIDHYSTARAHGSIRRADVVVHIVDAPTEISRIDKKLARYVLDNWKPCVLAVNKVDLAPDIRLEQWEAYARHRLPGVAFAPLVCISALSGQNVMQMVRMVWSLHEQTAIRVATGDLMKVIREATQSVPPPSDRSRRAKVYYATQVATGPPTVALFTNHPDLINGAYQRYLANRLRESLPYTSIPIRFVVRGRRPSEAEGQP
jgi:GTP-binding protein